MPGAVERSPFAVVAGKRRAYFYACSSFHHRGRAVCTNSLEMRLQDADEAILTALERNLLDLGVLEEAMSRALEVAAAGQPDLDARRTELRAVDQVRVSLSGWAWQNLPHSASVWDFVFDSFLACFTQSRL